MNKYLFLLASGLFIFTLACNPDELEGPIDEALLPYVEDFIFEANARGVNLDIDSLGIEITFQNIGDPNVLGRCNRDQSGNGLAIDIDPVYWKLATELRKEYVMFHELGHCVLNRDHTSASGPTGTCLSIMEPGTGVDCMSNYSEFTRDELLDELFQ